MKKLLFILLLCSGYANSQTMIDSYRFAGLDLTGLLATYNFNDNANDGYNSYNGTLTNATYGTSGVIDKSLECDGTEDYVTIPDNSVFSPVASEFSICFWFNIDDNGENHFFINKREATPEEWQAWYGSAGTLNFVFMDGLSTVSIGQTYTFTPTINTWYHFAITYDGGSSASGVVMYVDGTEVGTDTSEGSFVQIDDTSADIFIGVLGSQPTSTVNGTDGEIDLVSIWSRELTAAEISTIYNLEDGGTKITD